MSEKLRGNKLLAAAAGAGVGLISMLTIFTERAQIQSFPPSLEITTRFGFALTAYREGLVLSRILACNSIPIIQSGEPTGQYLSGGEAVQRMVLFAKDPSILAFGRNDFSSCDRPWVNPKREPVQ